MNIRDKIPLYVFDTALRAREERKKAALRQGGVLWGASFMTPEELINRLYAQASENPPPVLRRVGRYALLSQVVREAKVKGELSFFATQAGMPGFLRHLLGFIQELKQSKVAAEDFTNVVQSSSFAKNFTQVNAREKFSELARIYARYEERKSALHVVDEYDKEDAAAKLLADACLENSPPLFLDAYSHVCLVDLMDVSVLRFEFLKALLLHFKNSGRATAVVFPYDPDKQLIFRFLEKELQRLESTGEDDVVTEHFWSLQSRGKNDAIRYFLEKFAGEEKFYADTSMQTEHNPPRGRKAVKAEKKQAANIHVFCVEGTYRELEETARRVRALLEDGVLPPEIGVLFRDLTPYEKLISEIFPRFSIPLSFRRGSPVLYSPVVKALLLLLRLPKDNFRQSDLLAFLRSAYFSLDGYDTNDIEKAVCRCGLFSGTKQEWKQAVLALSRQAHLQSEAYAAEDAAAPRSAERMKKLQQDAQHLQYVSGTLFSLLSLFDAFAREAVFSHFLKAYEKLMRKFNVERNASLVSMPSILKRDRESLSVFHNTLEELRALFEPADAVMDVQDFYDMAVESMSEEVTPSPSADGGVMVLNIGDAVGFRFSHVFLPSLTENNFPKKQFENPLLRSAERVPLRKCLNRPSSFRTLPEKYLEDPLLFYLAMHCAEKQVFLSYSTMDFQGRLTVRSRFVDEVLEAFQDAECPYVLDKAASPLDENGEPVPVPYVSASDAPPPRSFPTRNDFFSHLTASVFKRRAQTENIFPALHALLKNKNHPLHHPLVRILSLIITEKQRGLFYAERDRKKRGGMNVANAYTGRLADEKAIAFTAGMFPQGRMVSASFLERYGTCAFQFFCRQVLCLEEAEETELEISPLVEGSFVHEVLAQFFKTHPFLNGDEKEEKELLALLDERWEIWKQKHYLGNNLLQDAKRAALKKALRRFYAHECEHTEGWRWDAAFIEREMKGEFSKGGGEKIKFYGRADKMEYKKDGDVLRARVVDFKNSKRAKNGGNEEKAKPAGIGVLGFQLPLYAILALEEMRDDKKNPVIEATAEYRAVRADTLPDFLLPAGGKKHPVNFAEPLIKEKFLACVKDILSSIRQGRFDVTPFSKNVSCGFCAFKTVCRYEDVLESPLKDDENGT